MLSELTRRARSGPANRKAFGSYSRIRRGRAALSLRAGTRSLLAANRTRAPRKEAVPWHEDAAILDAGRPDLGLQLF